MELADLLNAIQICDNGELNFNQGDSRAFLYGRKWYPLRAVVNSAANQAGENHDLTTDQALVELVYLVPYTRIKEVTFNNEFPVQIDEHETIGEIAFIKNVLGKLVD